RAGRGRGGGRRRGCSTPARRAAPRLGNRSWRRHDRDRAGAHWLARARPRFGQHGISRRDPLSLHDDPPDPFERHLARRGEPVNALRDDRASAAVTTVVLLPLLLTVLAGVLLLGALRVAAARVRAAAALAPLARVTDPA